LSQYVHTPGGFFGEFSSAASEIVNWAQSRFDGAFLLCFQGLSRRRAGVFSLGTHVLGEPVPLRATIVQLKFV
jgi:hypothetical protein